MTIEVLRVDAAVVRPLRHAVLRPGADPGESVYPADDLAETVHLAASNGAVVIGTATLFPEAFRRPRCLAAARHGRCGGAPGHGRRLNSAE